MKEPERDINRDLEGGCKSGECAITDAKHRNCLKESIKQDTVLNSAKRPG